MSDPRSKSLAWLLTVLMFFSAGTWAAEKPNVLFIVSEDNGPELGCYGDPYARTPNLDRLASDGVRFERAFVPYAVCSPSRACFLTGLYNHQNGHIGLATHRFALYSSGIPNIPSLLKTRGYRTGMIGKLHVNPREAFPVDFRRYTGSNFRHRNVEEFAAAAVEFMDGSDEPFFLAINYPDSHLPFIRQQFGRPRDPLSGADVKPLPFSGLDSPRIREVTADYYNCLARLDEGIGLLLGELERIEKAQNTLVIYIGDHGAEFPRGKSSVYEAGLRIPFIVRWPGKAKAGVVREELVSTLDILPTIIEAAGGTPAAGLPGYSLATLLRDETPESWRRYIFGITTGSFARAFYLSHSARDDRYKLISNPRAGTRNLIAVGAQDPSYPHYGISDARPEELAAAPAHVQKAYALWRNPPRYELYDLERDPQEWKNLAEDAAHRDVKARLVRALEDFQRETRDPFIDPKNVELFAREQLVSRRALYRRQNKSEWSYLEAFSEWREARGVEVTDVFRVGVGPYPRYRIPAVVTSNSGVVLAFSEARQGRSDQSQNDIVLKRSHDGGRNWGPLQVLHAHPRDAFNDPTALVLRQTGRILLFFELYPDGTDTRSVLPGHSGERICSILVMHSDDDGATWSAPRDITTQVKKASEWTSVGSGPGVAIELRRGERRGRIVVPAYYGPYPEWNAFSYYSDDGGETFKRGQDTEELMNECQVVELTDGRLMLNMRNDRGKGQRAVALSEDGGETWGPVRFEPALPEPVCQASLLRFSDPLDGEPSRLLFSNPADPTERIRMTVRLSYDEGKTWPVNKVIHPGPAAYSSLTRLRDGAIGVLFEAGDDHRYETVRFARFSLEWLTDGKDSFLRP